MYHYFRVCVRQLLEHLRGEIEMRYTAIFGQLASKTPLWIRDKHLSTIFLSSVRGYSDYGAIQQAGNQRPTEHMITGLVAWPTYLENLGTTLPSRSIYLIISISDHAPRTQKTSIQTGPSSFPPPGSLSLHFTSPSSTSGHGTRISPVSNHGVCHFRPRITTGRSILLHPVAHYLSRS